MKTGFFHQLVSDALRAVCGLLYPCSRVIKHSLVSFCFTHHAIELSPQIQLKIKSRPEYIEALHLEVDAEF